MSVFHFRAILKGRTTDGHYVYTFYPDYISDPDITGIFLVNPESFVAEIIEAANAEEKGLVSTDSKAVLGLAAKIKDYVNREGKFPEEIFRIA